MDEEAWREIEGYGGKYWVSNAGRVKNSDGHIIKQKINPSGYLQVPLFKDKKCRRRLVHRLVALAFIDIPHYCTEVNHIDGNKLNNHAKNLQWTTKRENHLHRVYVLGKNSILPKRVKCVETGLIYPSVSVASRAMNLKSPTSISKVTHGRQNTAKGYHWVLI